MAPQGDPQPVLVDEMNIFASSGRVFVLQVVVGFDEAANGATLLAVVPNHEFPKQLHDVRACSGGHRRSTEGQPFVRSVFLASAPKLKCAGGKPKTPPLGWTRRRADIVQREPTGCS